MGTVVGFTGGTTENTTWDEVNTRTTGYVKAVLVEFDAGVAGYEILVKQFLRMYDSAQLNRQEPDVGEDYRSAIFYVTYEQKEIAEQVGDGLQLKLDDKIATEISETGPFYRAEEYRHKFAERTGDHKTLHCLREGVVVVNNYVRTGLNSPTCGKFIRSTGIPQRT